MPTSPSQRPAGSSEAAAARKPRPSELFADNALGALRAAHVALEDFYVEDATRCRRALSAPVPTVRLESVQEMRETTLAAWGSSSGDARAWRTTSAEELSSLLGFDAERPRGLAASDAVALPAPSPELRERLQQLLREMQLVRGNVLHPTVTLTYGHDEFVLRGAGNDRTRGGVLPHFRLDLAATVRRGDATSLWRRSLAAFAESALIAQLESARDPLADLRFVAEGLDAWPAPHGRFNVLWGPEALAAFLEPLAHGLEADQFLAGRGALPLASEQPLPAPLGFSLLDDGAPVETNGIDQEGNASSPLVLVDAGGVRQLAASAALSAMLGRPATGHGRRSGAIAAPTPVLWRPRLEGRERSATLAETLGNGIVVRRCDVILRGTEATLVVEDARLMHGGVAGERIEAFAVRASYGALLASLRAFGDKTETVGRLRAKHGQAWITEWHLPLAASLDFPVPGSVPPEHYW